MVALGVFWVLVALVCWSLSRAAAIGDEIGEHGMAERRDRDWPWPEKDRS
jgi:hypothetical protein